jgi:hypothetical protein
MNAAVVPGLKWKPAKESIQELVDSLTQLTQFTTGLPEARRAVEEDAEKAGFVFEVSLDRRPSNRVHQEEVVMQPEPVPKDTFLSFVSDLLERDVLCSVSTDRETLDLSFFEGMTPSRLSNYLAGEQFETGFVSWVSDDGRTKYRYCQVRS